MRHETPRAIANILARHVPQSVRSVLDPCVGNGALIGPMLDRLNSNTQKITCMDIDPSVIYRARQAIKAKYTGRLEIFADDFISWGKKTKMRYDCIVMNPPFMGKKSNWANLPKDVSDNHKKIPLEGEFVRIAIGLLNPGGVLLCIVPSSVACGASMTWLRKEMLEKGSIKYMHELPGYSFPGIEGRMYLLVYEKSVRRKNIVLLNHGHFSQRMLIPSEKLGGDVRFDFGYHDACQSLITLEKNNLCCGWKPFGHVADIFQGSERSVKSDLSTIHSSSFRDGFWHAGTHYKGITKDDVRYARPTDILLKRIGRNCSRSFGCLSSMVSVPCTDHVWILRPKFEENMISILFAIRTLAHWEKFPLILERGVGASYIVSYDVLNLRVPLGLFRQFPKKYALYLEAIKKNDLSSMERIEQSVSETMTKKVSISSLQRVA